MTDAEIVRLVAEKVFGWQVVPRYACCGIAHDHGASREWNPIQSDAIAVAVLDKMADRGFHWDISFFGLNWHVRCYPGTVGMEGQVAQEDDESRNRAICIAALKACGVEL